MTEKTSDKTTHFGFTEVPIGEKARRVGDVFRSVASRYDLMNDVMSVSSHRLLKRITLESAAIRPGHMVLDLAGGTGDVAALLVPLVGAGGQVVLADINGAMLETGRDRLLDRGIASINYLQADAESLPLPDDTFDRITLCFGLRNVTRKEVALTEAHRVLAPGGRLVVLEFSKPRNRLLRRAYDSLRSTWPHIGRVLAGDEDSYRYLNESIDMHPGQEELLGMFEDAGLTRCRYQNLLDGVAAVHIGEKA